MARCSKKYSFSEVDGIQGEKKGQQIGGSRFETCSPVFMMFPQWCQSYRSPWEIQKSRVNILCSLSAKMHSTEMAEQRSPTLCRGDVRVYFPCAMQSPMFMQTSIPHIVLRRTSTCQNARGHFVKETGLGAVTFSRHTVVHSQPLLF